MDEYLLKLHNIDRDYPWAELWDVERFCSSPSQLAYMLATRLHDSDAGLDEETWQTLELIAENFGSNVRGRVLYNLFHRRHDT